MVGMVFDHYPHGGNERLLAVKLADNAHDDGTSIYPSVATLAEQTCQSERSVQYQLKRMLEMGWLELVREARGGGRGGGYGRPREYRINPIWVKAHDSRTPYEARPKWEPLSLGKPHAKTRPKAQKEMGATFAPISETPISDKWVQPSAEMGAIAVAEMGATAIAPEPPLTVIEQKTPQPPAVAEGGRAVERFIDAYPKKESELAVRRTWRRLAPDAALERTILAAVHAWCQTEQWQEESGRYAPDPASWLRGRRWTDALPNGVVNEGPAQAATWRSTREGIEAEGERLGLGRWDQRAFECGRGIQWVEYRNRVEQAHLSEVQSVVAKAVRRAER